MRPLQAIAAIAERRDLDPSHSPAVLAEVEAIIRSPGIDDPSLVDLTHLPFVTIDEEQSKDLDQALFVERDGDGYLVWYAIADADHFVRPGTALFAEALRRGSTYYLPGLVVPMLPRALSEDLVSINAGVDRRALVFRVQLRSDGSVVETRLIRGRVRSRVKTWYDAVQEVYDGLRPCPGGDEVARSLDLLAVVGDLRIDAAEARDVIRYRRAELAVSLPKGEHRFVALTDPRNDCECFNEQISLLCNMEGARLLREGAGPHVQPIFRTHRPPAPQRLSNLVELIEALVRAHSLDPALWRWERSRTSLRRYLDGLPRTGPEGRIARALHRQAIMSGGSANFAAVPGMHYGVGADEYSRFTAPMREVVGIFTHKEAWEMLGHSHRPDAEDERTREAVIDAAVESRQLQREIDREVNGLVLAQLYQDDMELPFEQRPERSGTVMGVSKDKVHVLLDSVPVDVKVYARHLEKRLGDRVFASRDRTALLRRKGGPVITVGDAARLRVVGFDNKRARWELTMERVG